MAETKGMMIFDRLDALILAYYPFLTTPWCVRCGRFPAPGRSGVHGRRVSVGHGAGTND
jgi:hypothetical protein